MQVYEHEVLVVGSGLAGLRAAREAAEKHDVAVISRVHPVRSHSISAQGGINASLKNHAEGKDDSWEKHAFDTIKGSDYLADQDAAMIMAQDAPACVYEMEHWGTLFSRLPDGKIAQRPFGGAGFPRTCYAADRTGHHLLHTLYEQSVKHQINVYEERLVTNIATDNNLCHGLVALNMITGELEVYAAPVVIVATGGAGQIYSNSTNALINTGSGTATAYRAGAQLEDMEFIQFHPTSLYGTNILISEAARGEGGYLLNKNGERFMKKYTPQAMELGPRDIVARSIQTEIDEGRGFPGDYVHLDLTHLGKEKIMELLPGIRILAMDFAGVDPIHEPIPIQPGQHYTMGGIATNVDGHTRVKGLLAAGEAACVSVHGANRLGGNSLLDTLVFGKRAGREAINYLSKEKPRPDRKVVEGLWEKEESRLKNFLTGEGSEDYRELRDKMKQTLTEKVGIFRQENELKEAVEILADLRRRYPSVKIKNSCRQYNLELINALELEGMLNLAETVALGALGRNESRGSHSRLDFPKRDDEKWLVHTMADYTKEGPKLSDKEVTITKFTPQERKY
ncbi:FAD-binding protein [Dethiobacter alkaliphilus]|uniref:succinate dehydrogenase n=1 Tax=Dethiobacter alkaliphilus AHT 1 TaxID=555088 RepID=C0GDE4_DETAL|nr:FAD-binding protein [Dethiobacter alkaliphilus]EEG78665.1 succinate dehydrogenase or fumarate reductase, flavoprotein subunit [Dethiobacter alkaliphilus AHT 1]